MCAGRTIAEHNIRQNGVANIVVQSKLIRSQLHGHLARRASREKGISRETIILVCHRNLICIVVVNKATPASAPLALDQRSPHVSVVNNLNLNLALLCSISLCFALLNRIINSNGTYSSGAGTNSLKSLLTQQQVVISHAHTAVIRPSSTWLIPNGNR